MAAELTVEQAVAQARHASSPVTRWRVAFSGGLDSSVLLHALTVQARGSIDAIHVQHGLQPEHADAWRDHVRAFAAQLDVPLELRDCALTVRPGESTEAAARSARYQALEPMIGPADALALAQHQDDQAETLLLQLLRGAGPAGLAAMPATARFGAGRLIRPLLKVSRDAIRRYARAHRIQWFDDPSNRDQRFDRNYLRHAVMPLLRQRWPGLATTLSRAAHWQQEAHESLLREALADWRAACGPNASIASCGALSVLPAPRARAALRAGCLMADLALPDRSRLDSVMRLVNQQTGRGLVEWADASARRYRDQLHLLPPLPPPPESFDTPWSGEQDLVLPSGYGALRLLGEPARGVTMQCHFRRTGLVVTDGQGRSRKFAQWCQERAIAPWVRERVPMLSVDGALVAIGGRRLAGWRAALGESTPVWLNPPRIGLSAGSGSGIV